MKELTREKAKAYDGLIERLKDLKFAYRFSPLSDTIEEIFPELKESEDDKMKKIISDILLIDSDEIREILDSNNVLIQDIDAWLEKQGEQKPTIVPKFRIGDTIKNKKTNKIFTISDYSLLYEYYHDINHYHEIKFSEQDDWELVEQNPAWSEEDGKYMSAIIKMVEHCSFSSIGGITKAAAIDWLKSLKNRIQPQYLTITDEELAQAKKDAYNDVLNKIEYDSENPTFDDGWSAAIWYLKKRTTMP